jgi:aconitate hydratase
MNKDDYTAKLKINSREYNIFSLKLLEEKGVADIGRLPFSIRVLVENLLRNMDGNIVKEEDLLNIAGWKEEYEKPVDIPHHPSRVLMQDFTGVPAVVDLASMRDAVKKMGGDPKIINPLVPTELIIDHSVQLDFFGFSDAITKNVEMEYSRNRERYELLKWAQKGFDNFKVVPPNSGICHQVNLEYLARVITSVQKNGVNTLYPDTLVGTDSHTTMINGIGVLGWGVGGIEAEAVMLGRPYYMTIPEVIGVKIVGSPKEGITATDIVLSVTELLRKHNVVEKFVEYFGSGMRRLNIADRATIANMSPEYGATIGFFPIDEKTVQYLRMTGRKELADIVEISAKELSLFYTGKEKPEYTQVIEFDLSLVERCVAGPVRPQDRIPLKNLKNDFSNILSGKYKKDVELKRISTFNDDSGCLIYKEGAFKPSCSLTPEFGLSQGDVKVRDGSVVIAAITSCTNTSNPHVLIGAGLLAKNAVEAGIRVSPYIKTSIVPGSRVVQDYLESSGLTPYLQALGFHISGFGCTTCIGNSGPLHPELDKVVSEKSLAVAAVLSGNRNFEARIHQSVRINLLMSPMLVVAFALAGRVDIDFDDEPIGANPNCYSVFLKDIWPDKKQIDSVVEKHVKTEFYEKRYSNIFEGDEFWKELFVPEGTTFDWNLESTYIKNPPYFENFDLETGRPGDIEKARALLLLEDSVTTDHISPAGAIHPAYPAGRYLSKQGVAPEDFNSYGSRRGNNHVMTRGTFGNIRVKNKLVSPKEGSFTLKFPEKKEMFVYDAALEYKKENVPLIVLGGKEYGTGSSRDWAAKGTNLLGIKAVIAQSFERIHRSNLVGMGVLPLVFNEGDGAQSLGLEGSEVFFIAGIDDMTPGKSLSVRAVKEDGKEIVFQTTVRLDSHVEVEYFLNGGILPFVLRKIMKEEKRK